MGARWVTNNWLPIIVFWIALAAGLRWISPKWESIARDGDFQFLPETLPSRVGQKLLDEAFPTQRSRSRFVIAIARKDSPLTNGDLAMAFDLGRRISQRTASNIALRLRGKKQPDLNEWTHVKTLLDTSIQMDSNWFDAVKLIAPDNQALLNRRWTVAYQERAVALEALGT